MRYIRVVSSLRLGRMKKSKAFLPGLLSLVVACASDDSSSASTVASVTRPPGSFSATTAVIPIPKALVTVDVSFERSSDQVSCLGSLVSTNLVLTAGKCVRSPSLAGAPEFRITFRPTAQTEQGSRRTFMTSYAASFASLSNAAAENYPDLALIFLIEPIRMNKDYLIRPSSPVAAGDASESAVCAQPFLGDIFHLKQNVFFGQKASLSRENPGNLSGALGGTPLLAPSDQGGPFLDGTMLRGVYLGALKNGDRNNHICSLITVEAAKWISDKIKCMANEINEKRVKKCVGPPPSLAGE